jgi:asparagine synthase (glutamine-hydrolysing)
MSGIVGILHFDGAPVDRQLLGRMTGFMAFRGPDAQEIWIDGNAGLGHTLLKTTVEAEHERQPFTLDGRIWIVADARVDARRELIAKLKSKGHESLSLGSKDDATDAELILRSYLAWDEACVEHLLGDFAFAIWDGPKQRLFCARDHLGVKPFFYANLGQKVIFSSALDCIRQHPAVSDQLNDLAIADFLLFDLNQDKATTSFADIQRVPPAHTATWSSGGLQLRRYWTLPIDEPLYFRKADDYVDCFKELLDQAVDDRLRTKKVGVMMSGGLDSPSLAATASRILRARSADCEVLASTTVIDGFDRNERYYAGLVAERLGIPIRFHELSGKIYDSAWAEAGVHTPEPVANPLNLVSDREQYQAMAGYSRVWFYGEGPDNALRHEWRPCLTYLAGRRHFGRLAKTAVELVVRSRRVPFLRRLVRPLQARWSGQSERSPFPDWLDRDFASRLRLNDRWEDIERLSSAPCPHPLRPQAYRSFESPLWEHLFSQFHAEAIGAPAEFRHPFVDLRLLRYMLAVPAIPWARDKYLLRRAMRGILPDPVLRRPKSPLSGDPRWEAALRCGLAPLLPARGLERYVDPTRMPHQVNQDMMTFWADIRPRTLNYWLRNLQSKPDRFKATTAQDRYLVEHTRGGRKEQLKTSAGAEVA